MPATKCITVEPDLLQRRSCVVAAGRLEAREQLRPDVLQLPEIQRREFDGRQDHFVNVGNTCTAQAARGRAVGWHWRAR